MEPKLARNPMQCAPFDMSASIRDSTGGRAQVEPQAVDFSPAGESGERRAVCVDAGAGTRGDGFPEDLGCAGCAFQMIQ